jgi:hypothetical protein
MDCAAVAKVPVANQKRCLTRKEDKMNFPPSLSAQAGPMPPGELSKISAVLPKPPDDARLVQIVGRHLHLDAVSDGEADPPLAHFAADGGEHQMFVVQLDTKHRTGQHSGDTAFDFNMLFSHALIGQKTVRCERDLRRPAN